MALVNQRKKAWLDQVKEDAARLTKQRVNEQINDHDRKEYEVNTREGVTQGTPVRQAAQVNPSEPDQENFPGNSESTLSGEQPKVEKQSNTPNTQVEAEPKQAEKKTEAKKESK